MENFENNEEYKFEEEQRKLRAESMMDEVVYNRFILGKEDPIEEMDINEMAEQRFQAILKEHEEFKAYYEGIKNIDKDINIIGENERIIADLEKQIEEMQLAVAQKGADEQFKTDKKIKDYKVVIKELRAISDDYMRDIEKFANAERPDSRKSEFLDNQDNTWKN